jgi:hypothetical protein
MDSLGEIFYDLSNGLLDLVRDMYCCPLDPATNICVADLLQDKFLQIKFAS